MEKHHPKLTNVSSWIYRTSAQCGPREKSRRSRMPRTTFTTSHRLVLTSSIFSNSYLTLSHRSGYSRWLARFREMCRPAQLRSRRMYAQNGDGTRDSGAIYRIDPSDSFYTLLRHYFGLQLHSRRLSLFGQAESPVLNSVTFTHHSGQIL
jgi:hypothetical protein